MNAPPLPCPREDAEDPVVRLLRAHIPLSLLMDLAQPDPRSHELYELEQPA